MENTLKLILSELKDVRADVSEIKVMQGKMQVDITEMQADISGLKDSQAIMQADISGLKDSQAIMQADINDMQTDISELKEGQERIEVSLEKLQRNLVVSLGLYTDKIVKYVDDKTEVLNKRLYKVETTLEDLASQQ